MRVYIAGPMTGLPDFNYPAFFKAEEQLQAAGYEPINPARADGREGCSSWLDYMRAALRDVANADGIAYLPGWAESRGAALEKRIGDDLGLDVRPLTEWIGARS
jgi:hypothetical protein